MVAALDSITHRRHGEAVDTFPRSACAILYTDCDGGFCFSGKRYLIQVFMVVMFVNAKISPGVRLYIEPSDGSFGALAPTINDRYVLEKVQIQP